MLNELKIENVAVIEKATVQFGSGFNALTGETGAGKSIVIDSINAILGNRTSRDLVRTNTKKACIWASFSNLQPITKAVLEKCGYPIEDELLLYREISCDGKSSCRINGMPASASVLREVCGGLINIHGQHDNQFLLDSTNHLRILDSFAQNKALHEKYYKTYRRLLSVKKKIDAMNLDEDEKIRKTELLQFQIAELEQTQLQEGEEENLVAQRSVLRNANAIKSAFSLAYSALNGTDDMLGCVQMLADSANALEVVDNMTQEYTALTQRLQEVYYLTKEITTDVSDSFDSIEANPQLLEEIEERLNEIYRLKDKYKASTIADLLQILEQAKEQLHTIEFAEQELDELYDEQNVLYTQGKQLAEELTQTRLNAYKVFEGQIIEALQFLNMPGIHFELHHTRGALASSGQDTVEFYISANAGETAKSLAKVASGGELSRIMLALESALADKENIATVIYDEIDTGVSGLAAGRIGEKLRQTSKGCQVICITHTAQIAAMADTHLLIEKNITSGRTYTDIKPLDTSARIHELAKMMTGNHITDAALASAKELLHV